MCVYKRIKQVSVLKGVKLTVNCLDRYELYRLSLELDGKKRIFMDRFFCKPAKPTISLALLAKYENY